MKGNCVVGEAKACLRPLDVPDNAVDDRQIFDEDHIRVRRVTGNTNRPVTSNWNHGDR